MERLAEDLYLLRGFPPYAINEYLAEDVLIDAGSRHAAGRILRQLKDHPARNRESMRRLAELDPVLVCFGHGRPLRNPDRLKRFMLSLSG